MIQVPRYITREYLIANSQINFVHSRCFWPRQEVGPALVAKGLPNCFGIPVRWKMCKSSGYFSDSQEHAIKRIIDEACAAIPTGEKPIVLFYKIGNGDSRMHIFAPRCWQYMMDKLNAIKSNDYVYV